MFSKEGYWDVTSEIKKVPVKERGSWYLMGRGVTWDSCPEVIHIEQILGDYQKFGHDVV